MRVIAIVLLALVVTGCGGASADLFAVERTGDVPGASLRLIVNDGGTLTCNGDKPRTLPDKLLLDARAIATDLQDETEKHPLDLAGGPQSVLQYVVRTPEGTVRFADDSAGQPEVTQRLAYFTRQAAQQVCGLVR